MQSALAIIQGEHQAYAKALKTLSSNLERAVAHNYSPNLDIFVVGLNFIDTFIDHFHHPKEDDYLFRALRARTNEADRFLFDLQHDHAYAAQSHARLSESLERAHSRGAEALAAFAYDLRDFLQQQYDHMRIEENIILPLAQHYLADEDWLDIDRAFRANRDPLFSAQSLQSK
ncbi:MAG TPA: hemerythrin domain-containing protein, partial [Usitatibacteraceae bacterium]|nr:hemerythrin domain-containing protein [Usitatibacteraceae bacterium]